MQINVINSIESGIIGLSHWSHMIKITDHDAQYYNLPGFGGSVPEAIELFDI